MALLILEVIMDDIKYLIGLLEQHREENAKQFENIEKYMQLLTQTTCNDCSVNKKVEILDAKVDKMYGDFKWMTGGISLLVFLITLITPLLYPILEV